MSIDVRPTVAQSVVLRYPAAWCAPRNPHAPAVSRRVESFLRRTGVLAGADGQRLFERLDVASYSGRPFPYAGREELTTIASFLTLWIFYDDIIEERGEQDIAGLARAVRGDSSQLAFNDPCHRAFLELGRAFRAAMSPAWVERHTARTIEWLRSVGDEARLAAALRRRGRSPLFREFFPVRLVSVGAMPVFCWVEYMTGTELPEDALADERVRLIERCAAELIGTVNDLMAWSKDRDARWPNLVDCLAEEEGIPLDRAFARLAARHNARAHEMAVAMEDLLSDRARGPLLADWARAMGHIVLGLARWHEVAPRYRTRQDIGGGQEVHITIEHAPAEQALGLAA